MTALISAELLRLRTVRSPRYTVLGALVVSTILAGLDPGLSSTAERADSLRVIALNAVIVAAVVAADAIAGDFKRGETALTYTRRPSRTMVAAAHVLTYAALGGLLVVLGAAATAAVGMTAAEIRGTPVDLDALDLARLIGGAALGGAVCTAAAALLGTLTRSSTAALTATVGWFMAGNVLEFAGLGAGEWFPFGLVLRLGGLGDEVFAPVAVVLLLAWLAALAVFVRLWALPRDLT